MHSFDIYMWIFTSFVIPGEEAHLENMALCYELPPYLDLNYSNQDKQSKNTEKYTKIKTNAHRKQESRHIGDMLQKTRINR